MRAAIMVLPVLLALLVPHRGHAQQEVPSWPTRKAPRPLTTSHYLNVKLTYRQGKVTPGSVTKGQFKQGPKLLTRFAGRHVLRLYSHGRLLDQVRFNFPLTAGAGEKNPAQEKLGNGLARGASASITVRIPWDDRITRVDLVGTSLKKPVALNLKGIVKQEKLKTKNFRTVTFQPRMGTKNKKQQTKIKK